MVSEPHRSRAARELAEQALAGFLVSLGEHRHKIVVIGGLNPDFLTSDPPTPHLGTTDVDLVLEVGLIFERDDDDFGWLEAALHNARFEQVSAARAWRWRRRDGVPVTIDILCDVPDNLGQEIALPGSNNVTAMNLSGPAVAFRDNQVRTLEIPSWATTPAFGDRIDARFVGLGGYILTKAAALIRRDQPKDCYDLAFVLLYNSHGGPVAAARAVINVLSNPPRQPWLDDLRAALRRYTAADPEAARALAEQMQLSGAMTDGDILVQTLSVPPRSSWLSSII